MGAGKTSVGRRLSDLLQVPFFDSDNEIQDATAGMSVAEIFDKFGEPEFRRLEREVLRRLLAGPPAIIATGGGAFMQEATRAAIAEAGLSVWLNADLEALKSRVIGRPGRPLLEVEDPGARLAALLEERSPTYALAALSVAAGERRTQDEVARNIIAAIVARDEGAAPRERVFEEGETPWSARA